MAPQVIFDISRSFVMFFFIFGFAPICKNRFWNFFVITYSLMIMALVCFILYLAIFLNNVIEDSALLYAVAYSFLLSISVTHLMLLLQAFCKRSSHLEIFNHFDSVDYLYQKKLYHHVLHHPEHRAIWIRFIILICIFLAVKVFLITHLHSRQLLSNFWLHCFFSVFMLRLATLQILLYVRLLKNRLKTMDEILVEILIDNSDYATADHASDNSTVFLIKNLRNKDMILDRILYLKKVYKQLYEISIRINDVFGWSLLFLTTQCFIDFTSNIYWTFLALDQNIPDIASAVDKFFLLFPIVIIMSLMANECSTCNELVSLLLYVLFLFIHLLNVLKKSLNWC